MTVLAEREPVVHDNFPAGGRHFAPNVPDAGQRLRIVSIEECFVSPTFVQAQLSRLPGTFVSIRGVIPEIGGRPVLSQRLVPRGWRKLRRLISNRPWEWEVTTAYLRAFDSLQPHFVFAQFGHDGVRVEEACRIAGLPLIVFFRGHDISVRDVVAASRTRYAHLFRTAKALIAVSKQFEESLLTLGAPPEKIAVIPSGTDCSLFKPAAKKPDHCTFVSVGRFVEKKAPFITIAAFARAWRSDSGMRLRMIGYGPLLPACKQFARAEGCASAIEFLEACSHDIVRQELRSATAFVQHSVVAPNGNCEGTPNSVVEASASGLPVIATRHGGIPDVVVDGETGLLVDEYDLAGFSDAMLRVSSSPSLAEQMGNAGRERVTKYFSLDRSMARLTRVIEHCVSGSGVSVRESAGPFLD